MSSRDDELNARCRKLERQRSEEQIKWRQLDAVCRERKDSWKLWDHLLRMQPSEENREQIEHIQDSETIMAYARELFKLYHASALEASKSELKLHDPKKNSWHFLLVKNGQKSLGQKKLFVCGQAIGQPIYIYDTRVMLEKAS